MPTTLPTVRPSLLKLWWTLRRLRAERLARERRQRRAARLMRRAKRLMDRAERIDPGILD